MRSSKSSCLKRSSTTGAETLALNADAVQVVGGGAAESGDEFKKRFARENFSDRIDGIGVDGDVLNAKLSDTLEELKDSSKNVAKIDLISKSCAASVWGNRGYAPH